MSTHAQLTRWGEELNGHIGNAVALQNATQVLVEQYQGLAGELDAAGQAGDARRVGEVRDALTQVHDQLDDVVTFIRAAIDANDAAAEHLPS